MTAFLGRKIRVARGGTNLAGVNQKSVTLNGEPVDITDDDSSGWMERLNEFDEREVEIQVEGVVKDDTLMAAHFANTPVAAMTLTYPDGRVLAGDFAITAYQETGERKGATTFSATFSSSGEISYTAAS